MHVDCFLDSIRSKKSFAYTIVLIVCTSVILFQGLRFSDSDYPNLLAALFSPGASFIPPTKGYLLEGLLGDVIGLAYLSVGLRGLAAQFAWWISGLALLAAVIAYSIENRSTSIVDVVLIVAFTRLVDTLSMWGGKFDPFLLAFLVLTANKDRRIALAGIVLASFTHPLVALISTAGVILVEAAFAGTWFLAGIVAAVLAAGADVALFHYLFPALMDRPNVALALFPKILSSGLHWSLATFVSALLLPFLFIQVFKSPFRLPRNPAAVLLVLWALVTAVTSCAIVLDHTRVALLLTVAPLIVCLHRQGPREGDPSGISALKPGVTGLFLVLFLARLVIPHLDELGPHLFWWQL